MVKNSSFNANIMHKNYSEKVITSLLDIFRLMTPFKCVFVVTENDVPV